MTTTGRTARTTAKKATATVTAPADEKAPVADTTVTPEAPAAPAAPSVPTLTIGGVTDLITNVDGLIKAYAAASVGDKTKARNAVTAGMGAAVMAADLPAAQLWMAVQTALATVATKATTEIDYTQVAIDRAISLMYAAHLINQGDVTPDGIDADKIDRTRLNEAIKAYRNGDLDAVTNDQGEAGRKLAYAKITRSVVRGSVEAHIEAAFRDVKVGTRLTVAQIRTASGAASDGAIAARVWPVDKNKAPKASTLDFNAMGVRPCMIDGTRGMEKFRDTTPAVTTD